MKAPPTRLPSEPTSGKRGYRRSEIAKKTDVQFRGYTGVSVSDTLRDDSAVESLPVVRYKSNMSMLAKIAIGIVAIIGIALGALFFFYAVGPWIETRAIPMFGSRIYDTVLFGTAGLLCIFINLHSRESECAFNQLG